MSEPKHDVRVNRVKTEKRWTHDARSMSYIPERGDEAHGC